MHTACILALRISTARLDIPKRLKGETNPTTPGLAAGSHHQGNLVTWEELLTSFSLWGGIQLVEMETHSRSHRVPLTPHSQHLKPQALPAVPKHTRLLPPSSCSHLSEFIVEGSSR